jgi:hypothetical protein
MNTPTAPRIWTIVTAGAIALGVALTVNAPAAHAERISESTIKSECRAAGGTYATTVIKGIGERHSSCTYKDEDGNKWTDVYTTASTRAPIPPNRSSVCTPRR